MVIRGLCLNNRMFRRLVNASGLMACLLISSGAFAQYNLYNANLHVHSNISNKVSSEAWPDHELASSPDQVMAEAYMAGLDVIGFSDHGGKINTDISPLQYNEWGKLGNIARTGGPTAIRGFEYSLDGYHVNVFNTDYFCDYTAWKTAGDPILKKTFYEFQSWLCDSQYWTNGEYPIAQFNHIWNSNGFNGFSWPSGISASTLDKVFCLIEMGGGSIVHTSPNETEVSFRSALQAGWHVGPSIGNDNQGSILNEAATRHTGIWATSSHGSAIRDALHERRVFASEDIDVSVKFLMKTNSDGVIHWMGETVKADPNGVKYSVEAIDPSGLAKDQFESVDLMTSASSSPYHSWGGTSSTSAEFCKELNIQDLLGTAKTSQDQTCFYLRLKQNGTDLDTQQDYIYSAPIWIKYWTPVTGTINEDTTWTPDNNPYLVKGAVTVASGRTLTIQPGTVVKFADSTSGISVNGRIAAQGSSGAPITFTSFQDDSAGGDSNYDGNATSPNRGDWNLVSVSSGASGVFENCHFRYGGSYVQTANLAVVNGGSISITNCSSNQANGAGVYVDNSSLSVSGLNVSDNTYGVFVQNRSGLTVSGVTATGCSYGIYAESCSSPTITSNTLTNNGTGVYVSNCSSPTITNNVYNGNTNGAARMSGSIGGSITVGGGSASGNGVNGLVVSGCTTVSNTQFHPASGFPYVISDLAVSAGNTITFDPGCVVKFRDWSSRIECAGGVVANGTSGSPINFTSFKDDSVGGNTDGTSDSPSNGDWNHIQISGAGAQGSFKYCNVRYGGGSYQPYANLACSGGASLNVANSIISNSANYGIYGKSSSVTASASTVTDCGTGVYLYGCTSASVSGYTVKNNNIGLQTDSCASPVFTGNTIANNGTGIEISNSSSPTLTNNVFTDNANSAAQIDGTISGGITISGSTSSGNGVNGLLVVSSSTSGHTQFHPANGFPYVIGDLSVGVDNTLTIDAGCVVKFRDSNGRVEVAGAVIANGTSGAPIYFTSVKDDSVGGNTDNTSATPAKGDWSHIQVSGTGASGTFNNCVVRYGGSGYQPYANLACNGGASMTVSNSTVSQSANYGIYWNSSTVTATNSAVTDCGIGVYINGCTSATVSGYTLKDNSTGMLASSCTSPTITGNSVSNNSTGIQITDCTSPSLINNVFTDNGIEAASATGYIHGSVTLSGNTSSGSKINGFNMSCIVNGDTVFHPSGEFPYVLSSLSVDASNTLTIDPGCIVKLITTSGNLSVAGNLVARGTTALPINFTSISDDSIGGDTNGDSTGSGPARADWARINVNGWGSSGVFDHCIVKYGGYTGYGESSANLACTSGGSMSVANSSVLYSGSSGIYYGLSNPQVSTTTINYCSTGIYLKNCTSASISSITISNNGIGVKAESCSSPSITGCTLTGNSSYGVSLTSCVSPSLTNNIFINNTSSAAWADGDISGSVTMSGNVSTGSAVNGISIAGCSINADAQFHAANGFPYVISGLIVNAGKTLTIDPGTVVKFYASNGIISCNGTLLAKGTAALPIYFTSLKDDTIGGDTNGNGTGNGPARADWSRIWVTGWGASGVFDNCILKYGGSNGNGEPYANLACTNSGSMSVANSSVLYSSSNGILYDSTTPQVSTTDLKYCNVGLYLKHCNGANINGISASYNLVGIQADSCSSPIINGCNLANNSYGVEFTSCVSPTLTNNTFTNNPSAAACADGNLSGTVTVTGNSSSGSVMNGLNMNGVIVIADTKLRKSGNFPYAVNSLTVNTGKTLTLDPGVVVKLYTGSGIIYCNGILSAKGTVDLPVYFTSLKDDTIGGDTNGDGTGSGPARSDWSKIWVTGTGSSGVFDHCTVRYGGYAGYGEPYGNLACTSGGSMSVANSSITYSGTNGIYYDATKPQLTATEMKYCGTGLYLKSCKSASVSGITSSFNTVGMYAESCTSPNITGCILTGNQQYGVRLVNTVSPSLVNNTFLNNLASAAIAEGDLSGSVTVSGNASAGSSVNGISLSGCYINADAQFHPATSFPYVIGALTINAERTLTIDPGAIVKFYASSGNIWCIGSISAKGTSGLPIYFTSLKDDTIGGDTNGDGTSTGPDRSDWASIAVSGTGSSGVFEFCKVKYGGYGGASNTNANLICSSGGVMNIANSSVNYSGSSGILYDTTKPQLLTTELKYNTTGLYLLNCNAASINGITASNNGVGIQSVSSTSPVINGCTFAGNTSYGVGFTSCVSPSLTNNTFTNNTSSAAYADGNISGSVTMSGNVSTGSAINGVNLSGSIINADAQFHKSGNFPYAVSSLTVNSGTTLTIDPGTVLKLYNGTGIIYCSGTLSAKGTADSSVYFTSLKDDSVGGDTNGDGTATSPEKADWSRVWVLGPDANGIFERCVVKYGGYTYYNGYNEPYGNLACSNGGSMSVTKCSVMYSSTNGIMYDSTTPKVSESELKYCNTGLMLRSCNTAALSGITASNNVTGIQADTCSTPSISDCTLTGNTTYGVQFSNCVSPTLKTNSFTDNLAAAACVDGSLSGSVTVTGNTSTGSAINGLNLSSCIINADAQLHRSGNFPYATNSLTINAGTNLTIDPGTVVKLYNGYGTIYCNGSISAMGTSAAPIYFTSLRDDTIGGDTNGDGTGSSSIRADWSRIWVTGSGSSGVFTHCIIKYGGYTGYGEPYASLACTSGGVMNATNSSVLYSGYHGLLSDSATTTVNNCIATYCSSSGVVLSGGSSSFTYSDTWLNGSDDILPSGIPLTGNIHENPKFVSAQSGDFRLLDGSPCINTGDPLILDTDGSRSDMGAIGSDFLANGQLASILISVNPGGDYLGSLSDIKLNYNMAGPQPYTGTLKIDNAGKATIVDVQPGTYGLNIYGGHWLKRAVKNIDISQDTSLTVSLTNGDADGDNQINLFDFVVLDQHFGTSDSMADLDGSGQVNLFDYVVIDQNFGAQGD